MDKWQNSGIGQIGKSIASVNGWLTSIQTTGNFTKLGTSITSEAGIGGLEVVVTSSKTSGGAVAPLLQAQKGVLQTNAKTGVQYTDDLVKAAQQAYPKLAGKVHLHHPIPQYLGGAKNQIFVPLDAAYHQQITNAFRIEWGYGLGKPSAAQLETIIRNVYFKFPIP